MLTHPEQQAIEAKYTARAAAARREMHFRRAAVYAPGYVTLGGFVCEQLTVGHMALLEALHSPYLLNLPDDPEVRDYFLTPAATVQLLWILSPDFTPRPPVRCLASWYRSMLSRVRENSLTRAFVARRAYAQARDDASAYISECSLDMPGSSGWAGEATCSPIASLVDTLATQYGWSRNDILGEPGRPAGGLKYAEALQYSSLIHQRLSGGNAPTFAVEVDRINAEMMREINAANKSPDPTPQCPP